MMVVPGSLGRLGAIASVIAQQYGSFTPASLFTSGVNGVWYDPSDFTTLFQDAAGTTPVTAVEQPVGLMLDKSRGLVLGSEQAINGSFDTDTGWTKDAGWSIAGGKASASGSAGYFYQSGASAKVIGRTYQITFTISDYVSGTVTPYISGVVSPVSFTSNGTKTVYLRAINTSAEQGFTPSASASFSIDNISVRELPGNHAFNPSGNSANFPVLSAKYNLLTKTEQFDDAVWLKINSGSGALPTVSADAGLSPIGTQTADLITVNRSTTTGLSFLTQRTTDDGAQKSRILYVKAFSASDVGKVLDTWTYDGAGVANRFAITLTADWQKVILPNVTVSAGFSKELFSFGYLDNGSLSPNTGAIQFYAWGADLRAANDALNQPAYQRVDTGAPGVADYDTVGFKPYLRFNDPARGYNNWLQTNSIDFTNTAQMFVSAGVRKLSDYTSQSNAMVMLELGPQVDLNNGSWALVGSIGYNTGIKYDFDSKGTTTFVSANTTSASYAAPITSIVSGVSDLVGSPNDYAKLRINGSQISENITTQGNGPFGTYPLYIGARAGSTFWFNGRLYGAVVAGKQASADEITNTETFINQKTGAY